MDPRTTHPWARRALILAVCAGVLASWALIASSIGSHLEEWSSDPAEANLNLLVRGFQAGQLNLRKAVPPGLAKLADPYDQEANEPYRNYPYLLHDMSYYRGKLYLYFGVVPAVILFWPWAEVTGHYLPHRLAAVIFCGVGFLACVGVFLAAWRRYFPRVGTGVAAACVLALGLASGIPVLLQRPLIYEVMVSCGFAMFMLALASVYRAMESPSRRGWWLAAAGVFYGLAVGSRPALLTGSVILAIPVLKAWRTTEMDSRPRRSIGTLAAAAAAPLALIVTGLLFYNFLRFGSPLAFGQRYQLMYTPSRSAQPSFSLRFLWFNLRAYFLAPAGLEPRFPFVRDIAAGPLPFGHYGVESPYGVLTNIPVTWLALAAPLALRRQAGRTPLGLGWLLGALALYVGALSLTLGCYFAACGRYEVDFLPSLILLAVFGVLGLESALEERRVWRLAARCAWGTLLAVSIAFNVLASFQHHAEQHVTHGRMMLPLHRYADAIADFQEALRLRPGYLEARLGLADAHDQAGNRSGAVVEWEEILRQDPGCADAENMLGRALSGDDRAAEAIPHLERAVRLNPGSPDAENNLGSALVASGRGPEAIAHFESALRLNPSLGEAENNLGLALVGMGRWEQAISHFETALSVRPELGEAHGNLGFVLARIGRRSEAIAHLKQALEFTPDNADDRYLLGVELGLVGSKEEAIDQLRRALRIKPGFPAADRALKALQPAGR